MMNKRWKIKKEIEIGRGSEIRESNPPHRLGKPVHYRCANPAHRLNGATSGTRTRDPRITNALLYQLSHHGFSLLADAKVMNYF